MCEATLPENKVRAPSMTLKGSDKAPSRSRFTSLYEATIIEKKDNVDRIFDARGLMHRDYLPEGQTIDERGKTVARGDLAPPS